MPRRTLVSAAFTLALGWTAAGAAHAASVPTDFTNDVFLSNLPLPRAFAFLPDGRLLFIEQKSAKVRMFVNGHLAQIDPIFTVPAVNITGYERGLQGIAIDPNWPAEPYVYVFHNATGAHNRLVRYTASGPINDGNAETLTLTTPLLLIDDIPDINANHQAGCLKFGPDGMLYLSLGEDEQFCEAQDSTSLYGQILRLEVRNLGPAGGGQVLRAKLLPTGNPLATPDSNAALVWAYGFRNPWSFGIDAVTGRLYAADVGEEDQEELDEVRAGGNYGWPYREGTKVLSRSTCPEPGGSGNAANGYLPPIAWFTRGPEMRAIFSGGTYRPNGSPAATWPTEYRGDLFYGEFYAGFLRRLHQAANGTWAPAPNVPGQPNATDWGTGFFGAADFNIGPDGSLWWIASTDASSGATNGSLNRIRYTGTQVDSPPGQPRTLALAGAPNPFAASTELTFSAATAARARLAIYDIGGRRVRVLFDGTATPGVTRTSWDGRADDGTAAQSGVYLARLEFGDRVETLRLFRMR